MGRNRGHQWGVSMAAYGEDSMATVIRPEPQTSAIVGSTQLLKRSRPNFGD